MKITEQGEIFNDVIVRYPRINRTYRFDSVENKTVPCQPTDDGAAYELSFELDKAGAIELHKRCMEVYKAAAEKDTKRKWKEKPQYFPYKEPSEEGQPFMVKAKLKGAYGEDKTRPPMQKDAQRRDLPADFMLTSGSKCNVWGALFAYNTGAVSGVSFRLKGVQVLELAEMQGNANDPFSETSGFTGETRAAQSDPFGLPPVTPKPEPAMAFDDEIPF